MRIKTPETELAISSRKMGKLVVPAAAIAVTMLVAGCGSNPSATTGAPPPKVVATAVPTSVADFGSVASPVLRGSLVEAKGLWKQMRHGDPSSMGGECAAVGGDLANQQQAFQSLYMPPATSAARSEAIQAYKVILSATDECGMAADSGVKSEMKTAAQDMKPGLSALARATKVLRTWAGAQHS